jgi:hypothetical protein
LLVRVNAGVPDRIAHLVAELHEFARPLARRVLIVPYRFKVALADA